MRVRAWWRARLGAWRRTARALRVPSAPGLVALAAVVMGVGAVAALFVGGDFGLMLVVVFLFAAYILAWEAMENALTLRALDAAVEEARITGRMPVSLKSYLPGEEPAKEREGEDVIADMVQARAVLAALRWYMRNAPEGMMGEEGRHIMEAERRLSLLVKTSNGSGEPNP